MTSAPERALASWIAARSVHVPALVRHTPLPGLESTRSRVSLTTKVAAFAIGVSMMAVDNSSKTIMPAIHDLRFVLIWASLGSMDFGRMDFPSRCHHPWYG